VTESAVNLNLAPQGLAGLRVLVVGRLASITKRETPKVLKRFGALVFHESSDEVDLIIVGAEGAPGEEAWLTRDRKTAIDQGKLRILSETEFLLEVGLLDAEAAQRRLYTPVMLAEVLGVSLAEIRRWHRLGLIVPRREVLRLPYFDFEEVAAAKRLAQLLAAGASPAEISRKIEELEKYAPGLARPLAELAVVIDGKQLLIRHGHQLRETSGQLRMDFGPEPLASETMPESVISFDQFKRGGKAASKGAEDASNSPPDIADLLRQAAQQDEAGDLASAALCYREALVFGGPSATICFQLADVLYRQGDLTAARERLFMALEIDENLVEAYANLGCILLELGEKQLAIASFEGALSHHGDYPDVHFFLARALDDLGRKDEALPHWKRFLELAPASPWSEEARERLASG
jgi:tetratricopeptide (TPR) repeat protein